MLCIMYNSYRYLPRPKLLSLVLRKIRIETVMIATIALTALVAGGYASILVDQPTTGPKNETIKPTATATTVRSLPTKHDDSSEHRTVAQMIKEIGLEANASSSHVNGSLTSRAYTDYLDGCLLSTTWSVDSMHYNISMMGSIKSSTNVGYYRYLGGTQTTSASMGDILNDLVGHADGDTDIVLHTLRMARHLQNKAIDLLNHYIICGQDPAFTRALLADVSSHNRDGFYTILIVKTITNFGMSYLLNYFKEFDDNLSGADAVFIAGTITGLTTLTSGIIDRLQDKKQAFSRLEAFLIESLLAIGHTILVSARYIFNHSCLSRESIGDVVPALVHDDGLPALVIDVDRKIGDGHPTPPVMIYGHSHPTPIGDSLFATLDQAHWNLAGFIHSGLSSDLMSGISGAPIFVCKDE